MFSKIYMAAAMLAAATAGESELFLIDQALEEYSAELAAKSDKEHKTPAAKGEVVPPVSPLSKLTDERKLAGCSIFTSKTGQAFSFKGLDQKMNADTSKPTTLTIKKSFSDWDWRKFQFSFCSLKSYDMIDLKESSTKKN